MKLFDRAIVFTDLHLGKKSNSILFNQDCVEFVKWLCEFAKKEQIKTAIFLGDWHDNRASINVSTLNYSLTALEMLDSTFDVVHMIPGNHDEYYKDRRDISSVSFVQKFKNFEFYNDITTVDNCSFVPWLIGNEHTELKKLQSEFVFGHFELPSFLMNAMVKMPHTGEIELDDLQNNGMVLSGHFHKRQSQRNIHYIGNAFPHDYNDAWDDERGLVIMEPGKDLVFHRWPHAPKYRTAKLSDLLEDPDQILDYKTYAKIYMDIEISYEEANFIKESFVAQYKMRDLSLNPMRQDEHSQEVDGEIDFESVDTIVTSQLQQVDSESYDSAYLLKLYREL